MQEALAGLGIAIGVALVFAVQVANTSLVGSASEVARAITGTANLQLVSHDPRGVDERLVERVRALDDVEIAAPALQQRAVLVGADGLREAIEIASADPSLLKITTNFDNVVNLGRGLLLPAAVARRVGVPVGGLQTEAEPAPRITIQLRGRSIPVRVGGVLGPETVGVISEAKIAIAALPYLQQIAGLDGRVTRILVRAREGRRDAAARALATLADGRLAVTGPDADVRLLRQVTGPHDQSTAFFAAMSALVGLLLAWNAMLLTAPERRREITELRIVGFRRSQIVQLALFEATVLGLAASAIGLAAGAALSSVLFDRTPGYLEAAFPLGTDTLVGTRALVLSVLGGVAATWLAAASPLLDLRRRRAVDAAYLEHGEPGHGLASRTRRALLIVGLVVLAVTGSLLLASPNMALVAGVGLGVATILAMPWLFAAAVSAAQRLADTAQRFPAVIVAVRGLRATTLRSLGLAATGAVAVFGAVAVAGAERDLLNGLYRSYWQYTDTADIWITNPADDLATKDFRDSNLVQRVERVPGVAAARRYYGGFYDVSGRRVWLIARSAEDSAMVPATEILDGNLGEATQRLRQSGWVTLSQQLAELLEVDRHDSVSLPTPSGPTRFRVAAITSNLGWTGGAVVLNSVDYLRNWPEAAPTALEIDLEQGTDSQAAIGAVRRALAAHGSGLLVRTTRERADQANALARQALERLGQISTLLLLAAALAMAAAISTAVWQRRLSLAEMRVQGFRPEQLRRVLLIEFGIVLGVGCLAGMVAGVYGELLIDRYLTEATGFPAPFDPAIWPTLRTGLIVVAVALLLVAAPGIIVARVPPRLALQE